MEVGGSSGSKSMDQKPYLKLAGDFEELTPFPPSFMEQYLPDQFSQNMILVDPSGWNCPVSYGYGKVSGGLTTYWLESICAKKQSFDCWVGEAYGLDGGIEHDLTHKQSRDPIDSKPG